MGTLIAIAVVVVLAPVILALARRWRRGAAGVAAGSVLDSNGGIGWYITQLRTGHAPDDDHGDGSGADADPGHGDSGHAGGSPSDD